MEEQEREREESYLNGHCAGEQRPRSPAGNQAGMEKLVIGSRTDLNGNNQGTTNRTTKQIYGTGIPTYYVKYKKEEYGVNALIGLIHEEGVTRVVATE